MSERSRSRSRDRNGDGSAPSAENADNRGSEQNAQPNEDAKLFIGNLSFDVSGAY